MCYSIVHGAHWDKSILFARIIIARQRSGKFWRFLQSGMGINMPEGQKCAVSKESTIANLIQQSKMILIDEIAMMHKHDLERIDKTIRYLVDEENKPFGGKNVILGGDFRQILPVQKNDFETIEACIKNSYLYNDLEATSLKINERVERLKEKADRNYAAYLLQLGVDEMRKYSIPKFDSEGKYEYVILAEKFNLI